MALRTLLAALAVGLGGWGGRAHGGSIPDVNRTTVVVRVGSSAITAADILAVGSRLPQVPQSGDPVRDRRARIAPVVHARLLTLEAEARGYDDPALQREVARFERERLVAALEESEVRGRITLDPAAVAEGMRRAERTLTLSQIVTDRADAAESLLARALAGESFAELARTRSMDPRTAPAGGRLPKVGWGSLPPVMEEAAYRLAPGDIAGPLALDSGFVLMRLDSLQVRPADPDSLRDMVSETLSTAAFRARQVAFLDTMKVRLHATVVTPNVDRFRERMRAFAAQLAAAETMATSLPATAPGILSGGRDRFLFTTEERALPLLTYDLGQFTIGDYADYMAPEAAERAAERADPGRVERDLDQYFRHHAYADYARAQGYGGQVAAEVARARERALIRRLTLAEIGEAAGTDGEDARMAALITALEARTPVVYDDSALARLPL